MTFLIGQENSQMSSDWINVQGRSPDGVKVILREETRKIDIYSDKIIDEAVNKIEIENEERTINYNSRKTDLRGRLNIVIDEKNSVAMTVNDLKDEVALQRSSILNLRQKINDADSSIVNSKQLIQEEKDRVQDELNNIPFYEVLIGKVENVPPEKDPVPYEDAIASKISREAIGAQLGVDITNKTIVQDGTLSEETVLTMLKGKVDAILTRFEDQREDESGKAFFDLYRYGLVKVYPFQEDDVFLNKGKKSKIKVEVESLKTVGEGLSQALDKSNLTELRRLINQKKLKNSESELLVKRLARTAKKVLKRENQKIKASENIIVNNHQF